MNTLKKELFDLCAQYVQDRIENANQAIKDAQDSAAEETKSSAGDKYETSREMMQQESERNHAQLNEANKLMLALKQLSITGTSVQAENGSLVITKDARFFLSISAGTLIVNGQSYFAVSPASPIGLKLKGQKAGDQFTLNGKTYLIEEVL